jgi:hypothetical protein
MVVDDEIKEMINSGASTVALRKKAIEKGMTSLAGDGKAKVLKGLTTFEEVSRVCEEQVELKPPEKVEEEVKPYVNLPQETVKVQHTKPTTVKVDAHAMEEYKSRIARWLSGK